MKYSTKKIATALFEITENATKKELEKILDGFCDFIIKNNLTRKIDQILAQYLNIFNLKNGVVSVDVYSANILDKESVEYLKNYILEKTKSKEVKIVELIDEKIIRGVKLIFNDRLIDASISTAISKLKRDIIN